MVNYVNNEILKKVDEIISLIEKGEDYQKYLALKDKMDKNKELKLLINEVKLLQKDVVHHQEKENLLKEKMDELSNNPLYREYENTLFEINNTYTIIENGLNNYFQKKLN